MLSWLADRAPDGPPHQQNGIPIKRHKPQNDLRHSAASCEVVRPRFKKGQSSPSRIRNNRRVLREKRGVGKKATQKTTHLEGHGSPQEIAGSRAGHAPVLRHRQRLGSRSPTGRSSQRGRNCPPMREWPCRGPAACWPCGGNARCTTCRVEFVAGEPAAMAKAERDGLTAKGISGQNARLRARRKPTFVLASVGKPHNR